MNRKQKGKIIKDMKQAENEAYENLKACENLIRDCEYILKRKYGVSI